MAKSNETLFADLLPLKQLLSGIDTLESANDRFGKSAVAVNERISESNKKILTDMAEQRSRITELNVAQKARQKQLQEEATEAEKLIKAHKKQQELVDRNRQAIDANVASIDTLKIRVKDLGKEYDALGRAEDKDLARKKAIEAEVKTLNRVLGEQVTATKRATTAIDHAVGSYDALSVELNEMRVALKAMPDSFDKNTGAINKNNAAAVALQTQISKSDRVLKSFDGSIGQHTRSVGHYENALSSLMSGGLSGLASSLGIAGIAAAALIGALSKTLDIATRYERIGVALKAVSSDNQDFLKTQEFLMEAADRYGLSLESLSKSYAGFKANTNDTVLKGKEAERIFLSVAKASATLQLSTEDTTGTLRAFGQMLSKGTVQSEELKGQIGERLYNAFGMAAKAMGVTTMQLNKMLERGEVLAVDLLPKLADQLDATYGDKAADNVNTLAGSTERLTNQTDLLLTVFAKDTGMTGFWAKFKNGLADAFKLVRETYQSKEWRQLFGVLSNDGAITQRAQYGSNVRADFGKLSPELRRKQLDYYSDIADGLRDPNPEDMGKITQGEAQRLYRELWMKNLQMLVDEKKEANAARNRVNQTANQQLAAFEAKGREQQEKILKEQAKKTGDDEREMYQDMLAVYEKNNAEYLFKKRAAADKRAKGEADVKLRERLQTSKTEAASTTNTLRNQNESGDLTDADLINKVYEARTNAALNQIQILNKANKQNSAEWKSEYASAQKEITDAAADWSGQRNKLNEKEFKLAVSEAKESLKDIEGFQEAAFTKRAQDLDQEYTERNLVITRSFAKGAITREQMEGRLNDSRLRYLDKFTDAVTESYKLQKTTIEATYDAEIKRLQELLGKATLTTKERSTAEADIAKLKDEKQQKLDKAQAKRDKDNSDARIKQLETEAEKELRLKNEAWVKTQDLDAQRFQIAGSSINGYFDYVNGQRAKELSIYERQKERELEIAGDNDEAKAAIQAKYAEREKQYARQQAIRDKLQALFSIAIDTAQAIASAAEKPYLIPGIIALGVIQAGVVAARPIPAYREGKNLETLDRYEGPALAGEAGREIWINKNGVDVIDRPTQIDVGRNDVIIPNPISERLLSDERAFEAQAILHRLNRQQMGFERLQQNQLQNEIYIRSKSQQHFDPDRIGKSVADHMQKLPFDKISFDARGFTRSLEEKNRRRIYLEKKHGLS